MYLSAVVQLFYFPTFWFMRVKLNCDLFQFEFIRLQKNKNQCFQLNAQNHWVNDGQILKFALTRTHYESQVATKNMNLSWVRTKPQCSSSLLSSVSPSHHSPPLHLITFSSLCVSAPLHSAHGVVEESGDRGVLPANGVGDGAGVRAVLQIQER